MKKFALTACAAFVALSFTSCKKDYSCTTKNLVIDGVATPDITFELKGYKKKRMEDYIAGKDAAYPGSTTTCDKK
jgi:hypothetical protein